MLIPRPDFSKLLIHQLTQNKQISVNLLIRSKTINYGIKYHVLIIFYEMILL